MHKLMVKNEMFLESNSYININPHLLKSDGYECKGYTLSQHSPNHRKTTESKVWGSRIWTNLRLYSVVLSIGAGSMFLV